MYHILTYGCQMNVHESEKIAGILEAGGYIFTADKSKADVIVLNTCCIRNSAEQKISGNIGALKKLKEKNKNLIIAVAGCMTQQKGRAEQLKSKCPYIDVIIGTHNIARLGTLIERAAQKKKTIEITTEEGIDETLPAVRTSGENAWVNIIYGCNNFCSYCIVPYVRGRERSRDAENILNEIRVLLDAGYKKITLLGQNVNSYGNDLQNGINFAKLLSTVADIAGDFSIDFMTSHPKDFSDELIDAIAAKEKISRHIHLPLQSGCDNVLAEMNRCYTTGDYFKLVEKIRAKITGAKITTDIMVGFPGETDEDHENTLGFVKKIKFDGAFTYVYSPRSGTKAVAMPNQITPEIKKKRILELIETVDNAKEN